MRQRKWSCSCTNKGINDTASANLTEIIVNAMDNFISVILRELGVYSLTFGMHGTCIITNAASVGASFIKANEHTRVVAMKLPRFENRLAKGTFLLRNKSKHATVKGNRMLIDAMLFEDSNNLGAPPIGTVLGPFNANRKLTTIEGLEGLLKRCPKQPKFFHPFGKKLAVDLLIKVLPTGSSGTRYGNP